MRKFRALVGSKNLGAFDSLDQAWAACEQEAHVQKESGTMHWETTDYGKTYFAIKKSKRYQVYPFDLDELPVIY